MLLKCCSRIAKSHLSSTELSYAFLPLTLISRWNGENHHYIAEISACVHAAPTLLPHVCAHCLSCSDCWMSSLTHDQVGLLAVGTGGSQVGLSPHSSLVLNMEHVVISKIGATLIISIAAVICSANGHCASMLTGLALPCPFYRKGAEAEEAARPRLTAGQC